MTHLTQAEALDEIRLLERAFRAEMRRAERGEYELARCWAVITDGAPDEWPGPDSTYNAVDALDDQCGVAEASEAQLREECQRLAQNARHESPCALCDGPAREADDTPLGPLCAMCCPHPAEERVKELEGVLATASRLDTKQMDLFPISTGAMGMLAAETRGRERELRRRAEDAEVLVDRRAEERDAFASELEMATSQAEVWEATSHTMCAQRDHARKERDDALARVKELEDEVRHLSQRVSDGPRDAGDL